MKPQAVIQEAVKPAVKLGTILSWVAGTLIVLAGVFWAGVKWVAWEQIKEDRAAKADTTMIFELRLQGQQIERILDHITSSDNDINTLKGSYKALNASHLRMLEKRVIDKDEIITYQKEKIQALEEALKKNELSEPLGIVLQSEGMNLR